MNTVGPPWRLTDAVYRCVRSSRRWSAGDGADAAALPSSAQTFCFLRRDARRLRRVDGIPSTSAFRRLFFTP